MSMKEYKQFVIIPDFLYSCRNLDNDERLILAVVMSYENDGKKLYMSKETFSETYAMSVATVKRKFASLIKDGILVDTGKGLIIGWNDLEFRLNLKKVIKTKKAGPGRKAAQNHGDTTSEAAQNHGDTIVDDSQNHGDTKKPKGSITVIPGQNQGDTNELDSQNHGGLPQYHGDSSDSITVILGENHGDTQLIKLEKELKKDIKDGLETSFFGNNNSTKKANKEFLESRETNVTEEELDAFLKSLDL